MREVSTERLLKDTKRVLEQPFWIPTVKTDTIYARTHDDHDGTFTGKIYVQVDMMGDIFVQIDDSKAIDSEPMAAEEIVSE